MASYTGGSQNKNVVVRRLPQFPIGKIYWKEKDMAYYLDNEDAAHIDAYTEVFEPIRAILDDLVDFHSPSDSELLAIWIMGTYLQPIFDAYPYISLLGTRGSGKTKVLEIVSRLAFNAEMTSNATPSAHPDYSRQMPQRYLLTKGSYCCHGKIVKN